MKRKSLWIGSAVVVAAVAAISLIALPSSPEWTAASPEALREFEAGLDAESKLYYPEAIEHFEKAIALDPDFVIAKLMLSSILRWESQDPDQSAELFKEVAAADLEKLRPRERFLVERAIATRESRYDDAARMMDQYLADHPNDPFVLKLKANLTFGRGRGDYELAERLYRRLMEVDANQVIAYNQLGYIAMLQGRFSEAEEYFTSYRFIAPDQANPHDSLGELYMIQGRYEEAEKSFENAISIKPDFWASYNGLTLARAMMSDIRGANEALDQQVAQGHAKSDDLKEWRCTLELWELEERGELGALLDRASSGCLESANPVSYVAVLVHRSASRLGDWKLAGQIEAKIEKRLEEAKEKGYSSAVDETWPIFLHVQGVRLARQGKLEEAEKMFREADDHLWFKGSTQGLIKLLNQTMLVETLLAQGMDAEAHTLLAKVRAVNPALVSEFEEDGLTALGLARM